MLLAVLTAVQFCHILDFVIIMPLGPQLMRSFGIGASQFALLVSAYTFSAAITGLLAATVMDRFDRKRMLLVLLAGFAVGTLLCGMAGSFALLMAARVAAGACGGVLAGVVFAIIGDQVPPERRGRATGVVMAGFSAASVLGLPLGLSVAERQGWQAPFVLLSALTAGVVLAGALALPPMRRHLSAPRGSSPLRDVWAVAREPSHLRAFGFTTALMFAAFSVIPFLSPYLTFNAGVAESRLDLIYFAGGLATLFTGPAMGWLADRFGHARVFTMTAVVSIIPILAVTNLPPVGLPLVLTATTMMMVLGSGRMISATALVTGVVLPARRGSFMSLNAAVQQGAAGLAAFVGGLMITRAPDGRMLGYARVGALAIAANLLTLWLVRRLREVKPEPATMLEAGAPPLAAPMEAPRAAAADRT